MERIRRQCDEVHAYDRVAERTGVVVEIQSLKSHMRACTSLRDLVRKYKLYGDGIFYIPVGHWPEDRRQVVLDNVKWLGMDQSFRAARARD
ncbi:MAG TPA: hypothetical protein VJZ00_22415 [Thermoanaerobaculia bacterium]|nr:hypothetical protein [Thermoanaerobaculia bacterium]